MSAFDTTVGDNMFKRASITSWNTPCWDETDVGAGGVTPAEGQFLYGLVRALKPALLLEIGTGHGFSTIHLATAYAHNNPYGRCCITTIEIDDARREDAIKNLTEAGLDQYVRFYASLDDPDFINNFDFVFLDAGHTTQEVREYLNAVSRRLNSHAVVVIHDALWQDHVQAAANLGWQRIWLHSDSAYGMAILQRKE